MNIKNLVPFAAAFLAACHAASMVDSSSGAAPVEQSPAEVAVPGTFDGITAFAASLHHAKFDAYPLCCRFTQRSVAQIFSNLKEKLSSAHREICMQFKGANGVECLSEAVRRTRLAEEDIGALLSKVSVYLETLYSIDREAVRAISNLNAQIIRAREEKNYKIIPVYDNLIVKVRMLSGYKLNGKFIEAQSAIDQLSNYAMSESLLESKIPRTLWELELLVESMRGIPPNAHLGGDMDLRHGRIDLLANDLHRELGKADSVFWRNLSVTDDSEVPNRRLESVQRHRAALVSIQARIQSVIDGLEADISRQEETNEIHIGYIRTNLLRKLKQTVESYLRHFIYRADQELGSTL